MTYEPETGRLIRPPESGASPAAGGTGRACMSLHGQAGAMRRRAEIVITTPARLNDLSERGDCRPDQVEINVLDEADRMSDMRF